MDYPFRAILGCTQLSSEDSRAYIRRAATDVGDLVRSTLGPKGMDKLIVRETQDDDEPIRGFVSNDGVSIVEEFEGETDDPVMNHFILAAEEHEDRLGDGTTTLLVLGSELLKTGVDLIDEGFSPRTVTEGFSMAAQRTLESWEEMAIPLTNEAGTALDKDRIRAVIRGGLVNGSSSGWQLENSTEQVLEAVLRVGDPVEGRVDLDLVNTEAIPGGSVTDSELIDGRLIVKEPKQDNVLPVEGGILLIKGGLAPRDFSGQKENQNDTSVSVTDEEIVRDVERDERETLISDLESNGVAAVFARGMIDDQLSKHLANRGIVTVQNVRDKWLRFFARTTGATTRGPVTPSSPIEPDEVGRGRVRRRYGMADKEYLQVTNDVNPRAAGIIVRGGSSSTAKEAERRIKDGLNAARAAIMRPEALPGGGAAELEAARSLREFAPSIGAREQIAVEAFADVLETVPSILARNSGHNPVDAQIELRNLHYEGNTKAGLAADGRLVADTVAESDAYDPLLIKTNALVSAMELTAHYLGMDHVIINETPSGPEPGHLDQDPDPEKMSDVELEAWEGQ